MQTATTLQPRMKNPAAVLPGAWQAVEALHAATAKGGVPAATLNLVHLRASQINGCSSCVNAGSQGAKQAGETDEPAVHRGRLAGGAVLHRGRARRARPDRSRDPAQPTARTRSPDEIWDEAARHYDEKGLAALAPDRLPRPTCSTGSTSPPGRWRAEPGADPPSTAG